MMYGAEGGIRTLTPCGATPSRWCVCQFRHFRTGGERKILAGAAESGKLHPRRSIKRKKISVLLAALKAEVSVQAAQAL